MSRITGIFGLMGSGKTMLLTHKALDHFKHNHNVRIFSNYHLDGIPYTPINSVKHIENMKYGIALLDEFWLWLFSRVSMSNINKQIAKTVFLSRKRGLRIYYTAQLHRTIDVMLREVTNEFYYPKIVKLHLNGGAPTYHIKYKGFNILGNKIDSGILKRDLAYYGQFYNTREEIGNIEEETNLLKKGIQREELVFKFFKRSAKVEKCELLANSGRDSIFKGDIIFYKDGWKIADVKSIIRHDKDKFRINVTGDDMLKMLKTNTSFTNYIIYPNKTTKKDYSDIRSWNVFKIHKDDKLLLNKTPINYDLVKNRSWKMRRYL